MKKCVLAAATLLAAAVMAFPAYAGNWVEEDGTWRYIKDDGNYAVSEWREGADHKDRWLDSDGYMAEDQWVADGDGTYYVDNKGIKTCNEWAELDPPEWEDSDGESCWYFFNKAGQRVEDSIEKNEGKYYYLGEDGRLQYGWLLEDMYYADDTGAFVTGWNQLLDPEKALEKAESKRNTPESEFGDEENTHWYYFNAQGKKQSPEDYDGEYGERKIQGKRYVLDENGAAQFGWVNLSENSGFGLSITDFKYYKQDGSVMTGWYSTEPPEEIASDYKYDVNWFYFEKDGTPRAAESDEFYKSDLKKINGRTYLFMEDGTPAVGMKKVYTSQNSDNAEAYFFGDRSQSCVQKGKQKVMESDGEVVEYYFKDSTGVGYTGVHDNTLYYMGRIQCADEDLKYEAFTIEDGRTYLVNTSGKVMKNRKSIRDENDTVYTTGDSGLVRKVNDEPVGEGGFSEPIEPDWDCEYYE